MSYQVLYRTYRPAFFADVVGQDVIVQTLKNAIAENKIAHAYLFCGPRGTGKTSVAKLFAKAVNCSDYHDEPCGKCANCKAMADNTHPDIIELDAASNNGVDDVRDIIEKAQYAPVLGRYKVYIIDEVHMLSKSAFNALLKTLEEPPKHVIFILATTDPDKILPTVLSRLQRYNFAKVDNYHMTKRLEDILNQERIKYDQEGIKALVSLADGGMRDALSMLEQCLAYKRQLDYDTVKKVYGLVGIDDKIGILKDIYNHNLNKVMNILDKMDEEGINVKHLCLDLINILKECILYQNQNNVGEAKLKTINPSMAQELLSLADDDTMLKGIDALVEVINRQKYSQDARFYFELALLKMTENNSANKDLVKSIDQEKEIQEVPSNIEPIPLKTEEEVFEGPIFAEDISKEEEIENKPAEKEEADTSEKAINYENNELLKVLMTASRDEKENDLIILNRIGIYELDIDKRKYYQALHGSEIFASNADLIIICGDEIQNAKINNRQFNEDLYFFINQEFGIDKMIFAIDIKRRQELVALFREAAKNPQAYLAQEEFNITRYKRENKKELTDEERLEDLFPNQVKVED